MKLQEQTESQSKPRRLPSTKKQLRQFGVDISLTPTELAVLKACCENHHLDFVRLFFREREGAIFRVGPHHRVLCRVIDEIFEGGYKRVIINVPPGFTKTELFVIEFVARGLAINPKARFLHASYSEKLVLDNSTKVRDTIALPLYQAMWPILLKSDARSKGLWRTREGGGLLASPAGGAIIGFRAGTMDPGFTGALIIDDPLKPDDARSDALRTFINDRYNNTFRSRLAHEDVPVIVVMQRIHPEDMSGYLLDGGSGETWHHVMLPVEIDNAAPYPDEFPYGLPVDHELRNGPLWPEKHNAKQVERLKLLGEVYDAQYAQRPTKPGGNLFKVEWFARWRDLPALEWRGIYCDTAQKTKDRNDYTVFQCWGRTKTGKAVLIDQIRGRFEAPDLIRVAREFWSKHLRAIRSEVAPLRKFKVEDKVSGTGLIQELRRGPLPIPVVAVPRNRDKYMRALDILPHCAAGNVMLPSDEPIDRPWVADFERELRDFSGDDSGFDDQVDAMMDGVLDILGDSKQIISGSHIGAA
jgi:predicted phage terminase large subunit-like protein